MSHTPYDHIFERHIYVSREADNELGTVLEAFIRGRRPMRWVSVQAPKGSGRTLLLERLCRLKADLTQRDIVRIFVSGQSSRLSSLNPLAAELYTHQTLDQKSLQGWVHSRTGELKRRLTNSTWKQILVSVLLILAGLLVTCMLVGFQEYATLADARLTSLQGWRAFFTSYLPNHWAEFPLWFLVGSSVGLPLSLTAIYLSRNGLLPAPPELDGPSKDRAAEFSTHDGLQKSLFELLARRKRMVLLVDDASRLPAIEQDVLQSIFVTETKDVFQAKGWSILIVTVDGPEIDREQTLDKRMKSAFELVKLSRFELVELQAIVHSQLPSLEFQSDEERLSVLEQAQTDVKALFAAQDRKLIDEMGRNFQDNDIDGEFTPAKLLAYRLARRDQSISKTALTKWMNHFGAEDQLRIYALTKSESDQALVINLAKSNLIEARGQTIIFDAERSEALRQWLKRENLGLWQQTHFYWFKTAVGQVAVGTPLTDIRSLSTEQRSKLRLGMWHALQLDALKAVPSILTQAPGISPAEAQQLCDEAANLLTPTIAMTCSEGDFEKADLLASNALQWIRNSTQQQQANACERIALQLWRIYTHSGNPAAHQKLSELATSFPDLATRPWWSLYQAFDDWRKGESVFAELPEEATFRDPDHQNLHRLIGVLRRIKQNYGFVSSALAEANFTVPEPVTGGSDTLTELELRALLASALNKQGKIEELVRVLKDWRTRLLATAPLNDLLGEKAAHLYQTARYLHVLTDAWEAAVKSEDEQLELQDFADVELSSQLQTLFLPTQTHIEPSTAALALEAENAYEQTRRLSILLGWQALLLDASFHLGVLLADYHPEKLDPEKWEWDKLFWQVLQLETKLGWFIHAPTIHKIRWERVSPLDLEVSIEDAYNVYQSLLKAGYPTALVVEWHQLTARLLNNYGRDVEDRKRSAELHEQWARTLAASAAETFWHFKKLNYEQAWGLVFAAQAQRWLKQFEIAENLLNEAESLLTPSSSADGNGDEELRPMQIRIELQRAWLLDAQQNVSPYRQMIRAIWRRLNFEDPVTSNVLASLLSIEAAEGLLNTPWPAPGEPANVDPDNIALSLPVEWFNGPHAVKVQNRFEFRFRQLMRMVSDDPAPEREQLVKAAAEHWGGKEKFAETSIQFAKTALWIRSSDGLEPLLLTLLETVRAYFSRVEGLDRLELEALHLLMQHEVTAKKYRDAYITVLVEFESLVEREKRIRQMSEPLNWPSVALWAWTHLWLLVDNALIGQYLVAKNQIEGFAARREQLVKILHEATEKYKKGQIVACVADLETIPFTPGQFVLIEDILALDLWLKCKRQNSETQTDEFNARETELREAVIQYVQQLSAIISERQVQLLALNILTDLKQADARLITSQPVQNS